MLDKSEGTTFAYDVMLFHAVDTAPPPATGPILNFLVSVSIPISPGYKAAFVLVQFAAVSLRI